MWHVWETGEIHIWFWLGNLKERDHLKDLGIDERIILNGYSRSGMVAWTGLIWLRTGRGGRLL
jgi:hypothetical protein